MGRRRHVDPAAGDFGGGPDGATSRSSLWGREQFEGCATMGRRRHVDPAAGAFGGIPHGATQRCTGCAETQAHTEQRQECEEGGGAEE
eukprot:5974976-Pyramimonas_sp.AAC.1